ncbi:gephyrin-like molybdotransferase Glp [Nocardioides caeni]|uniref:Molybdopterin molybdenumtransferase n=1 Tax=Nocardioides caeni TaxID=574700 RepID=A0A4S8NFN7_9ACTN|nr:gephyrin-like molybdotransferase Glp [Nocardioides caeni]THV14801.1 molybdopterin molybdotransferase MoeA [Nocardioides caeni]
MPDPSVEDHRARILAGIVPTAATERIAVVDALGRVLAEDVAAALSVPPFDHAAMDGFAVRAADVATASDAAPVVLPVAAAVAAGDELVDLPDGAAIRIMTGAPVPPGADLVVPFEWTDAGDPVTIGRSAPPGRHIRRAGEDVAAGEVALGAGTRLGPGSLGLLTSVGASEVVVRARPRVAILSTGAELVDGHVPDSNSITLASAARGAGADPVVRGPVSDDPAAFRARLLAAAADSDLVVTTGGVSAGDHDVVKAVLRHEDDFWFGPVAMKPGRPQGCGHLEADGRRVPVVTLPGTPIAALASFLLYVVPAITALTGREWRRRSAELATDVTGTDRTVLLPARRDDTGRWQPLPGHAGHSQRLLAQADALLVVPPRGRVVPAGTHVEVLTLHPELHHEEVW